MSGVRRPFKVTYHYSGCRRHDPETGALWIDTSHPINGKSSSHDPAKVEAIAREVSRRGGRAEVTHVDPTTGAVTHILTAEPFEVALIEMTAEMTR